MCIFNRQEELLARVAAVKRLAAGDPDDAVVRGKRSETPEGCGQECFTRDVQRLPMRRNGESGGIAADEIQIESRNTQSGCSVTP